MNTTNTTRSEPRDPNAEADPLLWREISFTTTGFQALRAYRQKLSVEQGRHITLGVALDHLIKSRPFCADKGRERAGGAR